MTGELTSFARLSALSNFNLNFVGIGEVLAGHAKPAGGYLFDRRALPVPIGLPGKPYFILTAFTTIAFTADPVHGDGKRGMCLV